MPIYEYRRPDGTTFELQQPFSDEALTVDPETGVPVKRVLHAPAVHFKGNGFYSTDYGSRNRERETAANAASSGKDSSSKDSSSKDSSSKDSSSKESSSKDSTSKDSSAGGSSSKGSSSERKGGRDANGSASSKPASRVSAGS
jgi:putative FmdB family regulatory protein